jgi:hypothetical protein
MDMRLWGYSNQIPLKPIVEVGPGQILPHLMKYYAHFGHNEYIICLSHSGQHMIRFFLDRDECQMNDLLYTDGGRTIELSGTNLKDWRMTFMDTGLKAHAGERLRHVEGRVDNDEMSLTIYADGSDRSRPGCQHRVVSVQRHHSGEPRHPQHGIPNMSPPRERASNVLGWAPETKFDGGLRSTVDQYVEHVLC